MQFLFLLVLISSFLASLVSFAWFEVISFPHPIPTLVYILKSKHSISLPPIINYDGEIEQILAANFTHHFVHVDETIRSKVKTNVTFHYVELGPSNGEPVVFLHGIPDTWFLWHKQMIQLAKDGFRCLSFDVKGFGQSSRPLSTVIWPEFNQLGGDFDRSVVGDELVTALDKIGIKKFNLVSLDLSSWQAPIMVGEWNERIIRYCKAQSTVGFHDKKHVPQIYLFRNIPRFFTYVMEYNPAAMVKLLHGKTGNPALDIHKRVFAEIPDDVHQRAVREFAQENNYRSWAGFYNTLPDPGDVTPSQCVAFYNYTFPTLLLQGVHDPAQPPEYYDGSWALHCHREYVSSRKDNQTFCDTLPVPAEEGRIHATKWFPNAPWVQLILLSDAGHYSPHEQPEKVTEALRKWLNVPATRLPNPPPLGKDKLTPEHWIAYYVRHLI